MSTSYSSLRVAPSVREEDQAPKFYQTKWFKVTVIAVLTFLLLFGVGGGVYYKFSDQNSTSSLLPSSGDAFNSTVKSKFVGAAKTFTMPPGTGSATVIKQTGFAGYWSSHKMAIIIGSVVAFAIITGLAVGLGVYFGQSTPSTGLPEQGETAPNSGDGKNVVKQDEDSQPGDDSNPPEPEGFNFMALGIGLGVSVLLNIVGLALAVSKLPFFGDLNVAHPRKVLLGILSFLLLQGIFYVLILLLRVIRDWARKDFSTTNIVLRVFLFVFVFLAHLIEIVLLIVDGIVLLILRITTGFDPQPEYTFGSWENEFAILSGKPPTSG
jgi:hypothetical protein